MQASGEVYQADFAVPGAVARYYLWNGGDECRDLAEGLEYPWQSVAVTKLLPTDSLLLHSAAVDYVSLRLLSLGLSLNSNHSLVQVLTRQHLRRLNLYPSKTRFSDA